MPFSEVFKMASGLDCYAVFEYHLAGHDIWLRLVETSPGNAEWRRDLSISHDHIGDMQNAQDWRTSATTTPCADFYAALGARAEAAVIKLKATERTGS
jgi:hypothetical protein